MFEQLTSFQNLHLAFKKAAAGKRGKFYAATFEHRLEDNLIELQQELRAQSYHPGTYTSFFVHEPKRRLISAAPFRDRVVHHALCNVIGPVFEKSFVEDTYANRVGKGTHRALNRCQQFSRQYRYVLQCDLKQFFPSLDHEVLTGLIKNKIEDAKIMWLIQRIVSSGKDLLKDIYHTVYFPGDDLFAVARPRGLPIGNLTSQFWANVYLNPFDHFVKRELQCKAYLRYVDDFLLFANDKMTLWKWKRGIEHRLMRYRLVIHDPAHPRPVTEGIPFLGFIVFPEKRRLKRRKAVHFQRRLKRLKVQREAGTIPLAKFKASLLGWINHVRYGNTVGLRKKILANSL